MAMLMSPLLPLVETYMTDLATRSIHEYKRVTLLEHTNANAFGTRAPRERGGCPTETLSTFWVLKGNPEGVLALARHLNFSQQPRIKNPQIPLAI